MCLEAKRRGWQLTIHRTKHSGNIIVYSCYKDGLKGSYLALVSYWHQLAIIFLVPDGLSYPSACGQAQVCFRKMNN